MPSSADLLAIALEHHHAGRLQQAEQIYRQIIAAEPNNAEALHLMGAISCENGAYEESVEHLKRALALRPHFPEALNTLGLALHGQGNLDGAISCYQRALSLTPAFPDALNNLGLALQNQDKMDQAVNFHRRAISVSPAFAQAHYNLGNALKRMGNLEEASAAYHRAIEINPGYLDAYNNLGTTYHRLGRIRESLDCFERALSIDPNFAEAHWNQSLPILLTGNFDLGWQEYEWRSKAGVLAPRNFQRPRWQGEDLNERSILVYSEQGLGDTIQFVRYAQVLRTKGGRVIFECEPPLLKLLARCSGIDELVPHGSPLPDFHYHIPLLSVPRVLKTTLQTIPSAAPYLSADPTLVQLWRDRLREVAGFKIGINWHGREGYPDSRTRDVPLEQFAKLSEIPGVQLISLQKGRGQSELAARSDRFPIIDPGPMDTDHGAFMDTAAIMMSLDLVITSDTAIPHLAGALAVPVWTLLPVVPDWRWLLDRSDSPWYPTMRLFRQTSRGDWTSVFEQISAELQKLVKRSAGEPITRHN